MTEEQKRFKILKRTSYEEQISKENRLAISNAIFMVLNGAMAVIMFVDAGQHATVSMSEIVAGIANAGFSAYEFKTLIQNISKKTVLQSKIEDINAELDTIGSEELGGMSR